MNYTAANQTCVLTIATNGTVVAAPVAAVLSADGNFGDYHLDTFAVESYTGSRRDRIAAGARDDREPGGRGAAAAGGIVAGGGGQRGGPGDVRQPDRLELCAARQRRSSHLAAGRGSGGRDGRQFDFAGHASGAATSVLPGQRLAGGLTSIHWNHRREGAETKNLPAMRGGICLPGERGLLVREVSRAGGPKGRVRLPLPRMPGAGGGEGTDGRRTNFFNGRGGAPRGPDGAARRPYQRK